MICTGFRVSELRDDQRSRSLTGVVVVDFWTYTTTRDACNRAGAADADAPDSFL